MVGMFMPSLRLAKVVFNSRAMTQGKISQPDTKCDIQTLVDVHHGRSCDIVRLEMLSLNIWLITSCKKSEPTATSNACNLLTRADNLADVTEHLALRRGITKEPWDWPALLYTKVRTIVAGGKSSPPSRSERASWGRKRGGKERKGKKRKERKKSEKREQNSDVIQPVPKTSAGSPNVWLSTTIPTKR
ncbi:hypothetical protein VTI74DRAFT_10859 [Chaetomium olivicolor]